MRKVPPGMLTSPSSAETWRAIPTAAMSMLITSKGLRMPLIIDGFPRRCIAVIVSYPTGERGA